MLSIEEIRERLARGRYRLSDHAFTRIVERNIGAELIRQAGAVAVLIEDYPDDKYSPSCLLLGYGQDGTALHLHVSRAENPAVKLITVYIPDPTEWIDDRIRRSQP
jgi:hypothetical protein